MTAARSLVALFRSDRAGARAKALRPRLRAALLPATSTLLDGFRVATGDYLARADDASERGLRRAATELLASLKLEIRRSPSPLPPDLARDVERWEEGLFEGTDVDVEVCNHALFALSEGEASEAW